MSTDASSKVTESVEEVDSEKSFFARGALLGLVGGVAAAVLIMSVFGSVLSLVDDVFGSSTAAAESNEPLTGEALLIATGEDLATSSGCVGCHTTNGLDLTGPSWSGLAGRVDEAYIRRAILEPNADIAAGFAPDLMPADYADSLSSEEVDALVAYISSL